MRLKGFLQNFTSIISSMQLQYWLSVVFELQFRLEVHFDPLQAILNLSVSATSYPKSQNQKKIIQN